MSSKQRLFEIITGQRRIATTHGEAHRLIRQVCEDAAKEERAKIVAWLRDEGTEKRYMTSNELAGAAELRDAAERIERGVHHE